MPPADEGPTSPIVWCFPVRQGTRRRGVVTVGHLGIAPQTNQPLLRAVERMVAQFWAMLSETIHSRSAVQNDPVSGLPTRPAFLRLAEQSLAESYQQCEPVAVVVLALEGLRELSDAGRWDAADELVHEVSRVLTRKVRIDDRLGRFDGSRFLILLRRVDSELASLIVSQLISRVAALCGDRVGPLASQPAGGEPACWGQGSLPGPSHRHASIRVRCGLAGSGTENPDLRTLVLRALDQCRRARLENTPLATDLGAAPVASGTTV
jgi:GGDEF domain-containing protein